MIKQFTHVNLWVHDQEEALAFYTEKLGMEVREDVTVPEMGNFRWLTIGQPGQSGPAIVLMSPATDPIIDDESRGHLQSLMGKGYTGGLFFAVEDCAATIKELKSRGVEVLEEPGERPYGIDAAVRDPSGNHIRIAQV
jgi:catechol 2,3-dioxygenase-like lactoylglutathione lyase family enzyme